MSSWKWAVAAAFIVAVPLAASSQSSSDVPGSVVAPDYVNASYVEIYKDADAWFGEKREESILQLDFGLVRGVDYGVRPTADLAGGIPADARVVIVSSNSYGLGQANANLNAPAVQANLRAFVERGGVLLIHLADNYPGDGYAVPGYAMKSPDGPFGNDIQLVAPAAHPLVVGADGLAGTADDLTQANIQWLAGGSLHHGILPPPLPAGATVLATTNAGEALWVEFPLGAGLVIMSNMTMEFGNTGDPGVPDAGSYGMPRRVLRNEIARALGFRVPTRRLSVVLQGAGTGSVAADAGGIACPGTCAAGLPDGTLVTLSATATGRSIFTAWSGCDDVTPAGQCLVALGADREVTASFQPANVLTLTYLGTRTGTVSGVTWDACDATGCTGRVIANGSVTLFAAPGADAAFVGWSGCSQLTAGGCLMRMFADRNVTARFDPAAYLLSVSRKGLGAGEIGGTANGAPITWRPCVPDPKDLYGTLCTADVPNGASVTLGAAPAAGSTFRTWGVVCTGSGTCTFKMNAPKNPWAFFDVAPAAP